MHRQALIGALAGGFAACRLGALRRGDDGAALGLAGRLVVIVEQDRGERLAHVPFQIVGQHAQHDMGAHPMAATMMDRPNLEIDGLEAAEGPLDLGELLVGPDGARCIEGLG